jgi:hypothetical protein
VSTTHTVLQQARSASPVTLLKEKEQFIVGYVVQLRRYYHHRKRNSEYLLNKKKNTTDSNFGLSDSKLRIPLFIKNVVCS